MERFLEAPSVEVIPSTVLISNRKVTGFFLTSCRSATVAVERRAPR